MTNAHYFRIDVPECAGVCQRRRSAAHLHRCVYPRRCRGLTEGETARAVGSEMHYNGRGGVVRRADPFSVNPGPRPGLEIGVGMHRKAVPL